MSEAMRLADRVAAQMRERGDTVVSWGDGILVSTCRPHMRLKNNHPLNVMIAALNALERAPDVFRKFHMRFHDSNGRARVVRAFELLPTPKEPTP